MFAGSLFTLYLSIKLALTMLRLAEYFKEKIAVKLWITPSVYEKIVFKVIALIVLIALKPTILTSISLLVGSALYTEVAELLYNVALVILLINIAFNIYRALEHVIRFRITARSGDRG